MLEELTGRTTEMIGSLKRLVEAESYSQDLPGIAHCAGVVEEIGLSLLGAQPERVSIDGRVHLRWTFGEPRVLILGHFDTVWPPGTIQRLPFSVEGDVARGPGTFDMKAGIVQALYAVAALEERDGVGILLTSDEEIGSITSRELIESSARASQAVLVLEPSKSGSLKTARAGVAVYEVTAHGRAAHVGLDPDKGINALTELAHHVLAIAELSDATEATTVIPTLARAGSSSNTFPAEASMTVDVRAFSDGEFARVDRALSDLAPKVPMARVTVTGGLNRPPFPRSASEDLFVAATKIAAELGFGDLGEARVAGGSDGNFTAGVGRPTLDGLGPVGNGAHADHEHIWIPAMPERAALVARLIEQLR